MLIGEHIVQGSENIVVSNIGMILLHIEAFGPLGKKRLKTSDYNST